LIDYFLAARFVNGREYLFACHNQYIKMNYKFIMDNVSGILLTAFLGMIAAMGNSRPRPASSILSSITVLNSIEIPPGMNKLSSSDWEEMAGRFLKIYFEGLFEKKARPESSSPPTEYLRHVRGFVTADGNYWENVEITLDDIRVDDGRLYVQCMIGGQYVTSNISNVTDKDFEKALDLGRDYSREVNCLGLNIIAEFSKFLKNQPCPKAH
jgi:hypothetical protein